MTEARLESPRIDYAHCPLCESTEFSCAGEIPCTAHPLYRSELGDTLRWMTCSNCEHVFTSGWFGAEAEELLFEQGHAHQTPGSESIAALERGRQIAAKIVTTVAQVRASIEGRWLEVGFGNGALLTTAEEFGFTVTGLDRRAACVERMSDLGYQVGTEDLEQHEPQAPYDVISMCDVLEHMPFPRQTIRRARELLTPEGVLFLSMPNRQSYLWRALDQRGENPYWQELEHYHNFTRDGLYALLVTEGLTPCWYGVSERYRACMEIACMPTVALAE